MKTPNPLSTLKDIHLPPPIAAWPPAPGWVLLGVCCLLAALAGVWHWKTRYEKRRPQREALALLHQIISQYTDTHALSEACAALNELLKRVSLHYYPREQVAALHGDAWIQFLIQTSQHLDFHTVRDYLLVYPYHDGLDLHNRAMDAQRTVDPKISKTSPVSPSIEPLASLVRQWIQQQRDLS